MGTDSKSFVSAEQELQFYCKKYGELLGIKNLYVIYKRRIWGVEKAKYLKKETIEKYIDSFKVGIKYIEE